MKFIPRHIPVKTGNVYIAVMTEAAAHSFDLHEGDRVVVTNLRTKKKITSILEISENHLPDTTIGILTSLWEKLDLKRGDRIKVGIAEKPQSIQYIRKKLDGGVLKDNEIDQIVKDVVAEDLSNVEMTYFVSGCYTHGLNDKETISLTKAIVRNGERLEFKDKYVVDKHCIGGVPGNRTTMIVVPIITAAGLKMPKTSSRAITSPSGTGDTMETLADVKNDAEELKKIAKHCNGFITWGGGVDLAAADDKMIRVRYPLKLDPEGMLFASIMAKKHSVSSNTVLIDIPYGPQAKVKTVKAAKVLGDKFEHIGDLLKMNLRVMISDGKQPIGKGIGPALEAIDVMNTLENNEYASQDLLVKSYTIAGTLLEMAKKAKKDKGYEMAKEILESGKALTQMQKIINYQGRKKFCGVGKFKKKVNASMSGKVIEINNKELARVARIAGAPKDPSAGLWVEAKIGDKVEKGDLLYTIYSNSKEKLNNVDDFCNKDCAYTIKPKK